MLDIKKHSKQYSKSGSGVELWCGNNIVATNPYRGTNFSMEPCTCGMDVRTIGCSPDTDEVQEFNRNIFKE